MTHRTPLLALSLLITLPLLACDEKKKVEPIATTPETTQEVANEVKEETPETMPQGDVAGTKTMVDPGDEGSAAVTHAIAMVYPTKDSKTKGWVKFEESGEGLKISSSFEGLSPGKHAYHIHLLGDCSADDGKSAGTHFHFDGSSKNPPADIKMITGDLGELEAGEDGMAKAEATIKGASLHGKYAILGRAVIVHEKGNDHSQPPIGAAGGRLGCGVIGLTEAQ